MFRFLKLQIFNSLLLFALAFSAGYAQSKTIDFIWEDKNNNESAGILILQWQKNEILNHRILHIEVTWYDDSGETISDPDKKPFIYLSDYDIEKNAVAGVRCLNFSVSNNIFDLKFQDSGELRFELPVNTEKPGDLEIIFKYYLSQEELDKANIDPISIPGKEKVTVILPDTRVAEPDPVENEDPVRTDTKEAENDFETAQNCIPLRAGINKLAEALEEYNRLLGKQDEKNLQTRGEISALEATDTARKNELEKELLASMLEANRVVNGIDSLSSEVKGLRDLVNNKQLPGDSVTLYKQELNYFGENFRTLRSEYFTGRSQIRSYLDDLGNTSPDLLLSGMKKKLEKQYTGVFQNQLDSIQDIQNSYAQIEPGLVGEIRKGPRKARNNRVLEGFINSHKQLKSRLDSIYEQHKSDYYSYRDGTENTGTGPIMSLENLYLRVDDIYGETGSSMNTMDLEISRLEAAVSELNPRPTARNLIIIGSILLFVILVVIIRRISLKVRNVSAAGISGMPTLTTSDGTGFDMLEDDMDQPAEYYKVMIPSDPPDIMLSEVHFHIRVIKSVYHLVQGAMLKKQPENFGGLMFGRQYKSNGSSAGRHILIVEKVVPALTIRPSMAAGKEKGALLVDEIEKIVLDNKKMALLGWFTSTTAKDLEMPDHMVKVHRTYFRDKWQLACLVHPGTENLDSGIFVRRKSGYFDEIPPSEYRLEWDELYQFAVEPPLKSKLEEKTRPNKDEFLQVDLNQNWCDSIVEKAFIHPSVIHDIVSEKESKEQIAAGQIANGFFYGQVWNVKNEEEIQVGCEIFIEKLTVASTSENPRELPGSVLLGWLKFDKSEIFESLKKAIPYHNEVFTSPHQMAVLINTQTDELRFFSRKHSLEMNNNIIETEEFNLSSLAGEANSLSGNPENINKG